MGSRCGPWGRMTSNVRPLRSPCNHGLMGTHDKILRRTMEAVWAGGLWLGAPRIQKTVTEGHVSCFVVTENSQELVLFF